MADIKTLKGFIKNDAGNIILPISRGELIFDINGNIAFHSKVFKAEAARRYTLAEINSAQEGDPAYGKTAGAKVEDSGKYGLMTPDDLLNLHEALARISQIETETGVGGSTETGESLKQMLLNLISKVGYYKGEVTGLDGEGNDVVIDSDSGIYDYINNKIINHLAQSDALKFKGTLGDGGNVTVLPTTGINNGDTYKVIKGGVYVTGKKTDGTDIKVTVKPGDLFIALYTPGEDGVEGSYTWDLVPSGNELETYIKVQQILGTEKIDKVLSGTVEIVGSNGISVLYNETTNKVVISGSSVLTEFELTEIKDKLQALENTVNGTPALGEIGDEDYKAAVPGLVQKTGQLLLRVANAVTNWDLIVEHKIGEDGLPTEELVNGDELVKASAVYDVTSKLATHIANCLHAEVIDLGTVLTTAQKAYLAGTIN